LIHERAPAKVNLVLRIGPVAAGGLHEVCSLFASLDLADELEVRQSDADRVVCAGVDGPNLAEAAIRAFRQAHDIPPLEVRIDKRIAVAGGLAGGSADAGAVLRAANEIAGRPFDVARLREIAARLGSDVPSQVEPGHAIVTGTGECVEPVALPELALVLVPSDRGLATAAVFRQAERLGLVPAAPDPAARDVPDPAARDALDPDPLRALAAGGPREIAAGLANDLQDAALSLRPDLAGMLDGLRASGALGALVSGSGPTCFGVFADAVVAETAATALPGARLTIVAPR
jgi:4-diphosphocytidyl-2-C-methyl-D-erythritol kinase